MIYIRIIHKDAISKIGFPEDLKLGYLKLNVKVSLVVECSVRELETLFNLIVEYY